MTDSTERPLISFVLLAYSQERFVAEAVQAALSQTYSPLEVILSDDCSPDRTFDIMQKITATYQGPHTIVLNCNEQNLGLAGHINRVMEIVKGKMIVVAAGDDVSRPDRVERTYAVYAASDGQAKSIFGNAIIVDEWGEEHTLYLPTGTHSHDTLSAHWMAQRTTGVLGCTHAWDREVFDAFGPIDTSIYQEDLIIPWRSALLGHVEYIDDVLVAYRLHSSNMQFRPRSGNRRIRKLLRDLERQGRNRVAICNNRIADLDRWATLAPARKATCDELKALMLAKLREAQLETQLYAEPNYLRRGHLILRGLQQKTDARTLARWVLTALFPPVYFGYLEYLDFKNRQKRRYGTP